MKKILLIISVIFLFTGKGLPQKNDSISIFTNRDLFITEFSLNTLYDYDTDSLMKRNVIQDQDTLVVYKINNKFYFFFPIDSYTTVHYRRCMFYSLDTNKHTDKIKAFEDIIVLRFWWKGPEQQAYGAYPAFVFYDKLFIDNSDSLKKTITVINSSNFEVKQWEFPDEDARIDLRKSYIKDNKLYLFARKIDEVFNLFHILIPREPEMTLYGIGNPFYYIFDKDFNFIEKKEIDEGHKYKKYRL